MDLRRLQHIVALATEGSFRRAAERAHLSQPAFSRSIQAAETELALKLFDRGSTEARCTPAGAFLVERARALLQQNERLERDMAMFRDRETGELTFGTGPFPAAALVPAAISDIRTRYPRVNVRVHLGNARDLIKFVQSQEHEFFIANTREVPRNGVFHVRSLGRIRGGFYARARHPLAGRKSLHIADLVPYGIGTGRLPQDVAAQLLKVMGLPEGSRLPVGVESDDVNLLKRVAIGSDTVIIGTDDLLAAEIEAGAIVALDIKDFPPAFSHSQLGIVSLEGRTPSPAAAYAVDVLVRLAHTKRLHHE